MHQLAKIPTKTRVTRWLAKGLLSPFVAVLTLLAVLAIGPGTRITRPVKAATFSVCPVGCSSTTINGAIALAAASGDVITVAAGTYNELVVVNKSVVLNGPNAGVNACTGTRVAEAIVGTPDGAFQVLANNVTIDGFTAQGVVDGVSSLAAGIWVLGGAPGASGTQILNNIIQNNVMGIFLNGSNVLVQNNNIRNNNNAGSAAGSGIYSDTGLVNATINTNCFTGHQNVSINIIGQPIPFTLPAVSFPVSNINVTNNQVINDSTILFYGGSGITVTGNTVINAAFSAVQFGSAVNGATVNNNTFLNNGGAGIRVTDDFGIANAGITASCNRIVGNQSGPAGDAGINVNPAAHTTTLVATNNWFGCNEGPTGADCDKVLGDVDFDPWLVLSLTGPDAIFAGGQATLTSSLNTNSDGATAPCSLPNGTPVAFATTCGTVDPANTTTTGGTASSTLTAGPTPGPCTYQTTVDNETIAAALTINPRPIITIVDPFECTAPGDALDVTVTITNTTGVPQPVSFTATLPAGLLALPGTCTANTGACAVVNSGSVTYANPLLLGSATITYKVQVADDATALTPLCIDTAFIFDGGSTLTIQACTAVNCSTGGTPGLTFPTSSAVSDQKPGSVLFFNLHTSNPSIPALQNTRFSITNTSPALRTAVHLFFVDGSSCNMADSFICLTPQQTITFLASAVDPGTTGYMIAIAVDPLTGCPISFNNLIGDQFVKLASGHAANLPAESFAQLAGGLSLCNPSSTTAQLNFDGVSYNRAARTLAADNLPDRASGNDTLLVINRLGGNMLSGAAQLGPIFGFLFNDQERAHSFSFTAGCQLVRQMSNDFPRTTPRYEDVIPFGRSGWLRLFAVNDFGVLGATINFNANATTSAAAFNQGHNLHKLTLTSTASLTIPIFPPHC